MSAATTFPDTASLLPPNATGFQRHLEQVNGITLTSLEAVDKIKTIKSDPPKEVLYWLIWEYGLNALLPYIPDLKSLIDEGLKWQRFRGTPGSLKMALKWLNIDDMKIEEEVPGVHFYEFQIKLGEIPTTRNIDNIINLSQLSAPVRSRLSRLYNVDYDKRRIIPSDDVNNEFGFLLSDYSGCDYKGVVLSFGRTQKIYKEIPARQVKDMHLRAIHIRLLPFNYPVLGDMIISDRPILNHLSAIHHIRTIRFVHPDSAPFVWAGLDWFGTWNRRKWEEAGFINLAVRQLTTYYFRLYFPDNFSSGHYRYTTHSYPVTIGTPGLKSSRARTRITDGTIPEKSAGVHRYSNRSSRVQYTGFASETHASRGYGAEAVYTEDVSNPPRTGRTRTFAAIPLRQKNGVPLSSVGSNWFGNWDERTWASPLFINIGVIHHGNTN